MIAEQLQQILAGGKQQTVEKIACQIPVLDELEQGVDILKILLRLDQRFQNEGSKWFCVIENDETDSRILKAANEYFKDTGKPGELEKHLTPYVMNKTGADKGKISETVNRFFRTANEGKMILNRKKG